MNNGNNIIRENYGECPMEASRANVLQTGQVQTPCNSCTSIHTVLKDRSPYDIRSLQAYNRLPAQYNTQLETLIFAP